MRWLLSNGHHTHDFMEKIMKKNLVVLVALLVSNMAVAKNQLKEIPEGCFDYQNYCYDVANLGNLISLNFVELKNIFMSINFFKILSLEYHYFIDTKKYISSY